MIGDKTVITSSLSLSDSGQGGSNKTSSGEQLSYHIIYLIHMFNNVAFFLKKRKINLGVNKLDIKYVRIMMLYRLKNSIIWADILSFSFGFLGVTFGILSVLALETILKCLCEYSWWPIFCLNSLGLKLYNRTKNRT
ncbi:hypothetical protein M0C40_05835 [Spiroplasma citri]|uniref:Transmembrane protein n=1 Tax=Spiroplasma citri TaxID=2133 RepID=A0AAX3SWU4_SPICI|nr:hypothetical protein [Spiroplasma citri]WFG95617.1 hypothetical protein M0C40_05835 [Spiroplasma citri]